MIFAAATNNAKKLKEIKRILSALGHDAKTLRELGIEIEIEENGTTLPDESGNDASGMPPMPPAGGMGGMPPMM